MKTPNGNKTAMTSNTAIVYLSLIFRIKKHIIIELKEKIKLLEKGKFVDTTMIAPGLHQLDKTDKGNFIQNTDGDPSTSTGLVSTKSVSRPKRKVTRRIGSGNVKEEH